MLRILWAWLSEPGLVGWLLWTWVAAIVLLVIPLLAS